MTEPTDTNDPPSRQVISFLDATRTDDQIDRQRSGGHPGLGSDDDQIGDETDVMDAVEPGQPYQQLHPVAGKRVALVGRLGSMNRREATNLLQSFQAIVVELPRNAAASDLADSPSRLAIDWIVIGAEQPPLSQHELLPPNLIQRAARGEMEILHETELWERLGLFDDQQPVRRYHTPAMLADLLQVSVRVIRRWHRRGLITPVVTLHKLPYFDYAEVATARRLAGWIAAGASPATIESRLVELIEVLPNIRRPLDQLSILVEGKQVLLRQGGGLIEPGGQMRFDFDALETPSQPAESDSNRGHDVIAFQHPDDPPMVSVVGQFDQDELLIAAYEAEDDDDLETAVAMYHTILARDGARADISFQIGELLYRMNHLFAARERFYTAIELDPDFVEARASLGAVLAELGQNELAIAALRGALSMHDDYADVHYMLGKTLDKVGEGSESLRHWERILELAPESPWAAEAKERLGL
ncbi:tetratricopeptide repeat protein [Stieleria sp. TO1_6]|uniref:MerR family transcriptional regulator n=1 Tax=Stieleria tagensis TaxID=2956795 RepID=UPI00209A9279|nr:MerR family transcriptional regulator [Stieleria tagensis]MCO8125137.1 tetratricopeptide repeat protein [Stieleria tagensis]